ncbi:MAG TPA: hypothetical protein GX004_04070, partial [Firmicutes bacterium]|nr:hypothetical protein [Bacillota bacterium]
LPQIEAPSPKMLSLMGFFKLLMLTPSKRTLFSTKEFSTTDPGPIDEPYNRENPDEYPSSS